MKCGPKNMQHAYMGNCAVHTKTAVLAIVVFAIAGTKIAISQQSNMLWAPNLNTD